MSTRTNIVIRYGENLIHLYRHHDGYLSYTGADLATKLFENMSSPKGFLGALLQSNNKEPYGGRYELTEAIHGDIEHYYEITFPAYGQAMEYPQVRHAERGHEWDNDAWYLGRMSNPMEPGKFASRVNVAITEQNDHMARQVKADPTGWAKDWTPAPLLKKPTEAKA